MRLSILGIVSSIALLGNVLAGGASNGSEGPPAATELPAELLGARQEDLLKWALRNSDPQALREQADLAKKAAQNDPDAADRRARAAELLATVAALEEEMPSESRLLGNALDLLNSPSSSVETKLGALEALAVLVEPIDSADPLLAGGGAAPLVALLGTDPKLEGAAAHVLAVAASNNGPFQEGLLAAHPDVVLRLVQLLGSAADATLAAAVHATGNLLRGSGTGMQLWADAGGAGVLLDLSKGGKQATARTQRRAVGLATDLLASGDAAAMSAADLAAAAVHVITAQLDAPDLVLLEKTILAAAATLESADGRAALGAADAAGVLRRLASSLRARAASDPQHEFVVDAIGLAEGLVHDITSRSGASRSDEL